MRNVPAIRHHVVALPLCFLVLVSLTWNALSADPKPAEKSKVTVMQVPTSGTILDVMYVPEFEEWWVKCREGDKIVVYAYERLSKNWRKVIFEATKPETAAIGRKPETPQATATPETSEHTEEPKREKPPVASTVKPERSHEEAAPAQKKWWDPILNVFKKK